MSTSDTCKNCGGDRAIHHFETNQCPAGGHEAPINRKQVWQFSTFESETTGAEIDELRETVKALTARVEKLEAMEKFRFP